MSKIPQKYLPKGPPPRVAENKILMRIYNWFPSDLKNTIPHKHAKLLLKSKIRSNSLNLQLRELKTPYLLSLMKRSKNIRTFYFDISWNMQFDNKDMYQLSRTLSQFKRLDEFRINIANGFSKITDNGLQHMIKRTTKGLRLINIDFDISLNKNITDESLFNFQKYLPKAKKLTHFTFKVIRNENISNEAVRKLCKTWQKIPKLTQLALSFSDCSNLNNETILNVSKSVKNLKNLDNFSIALENYCKDEIYAEFKNNILQLENLHRLQIQFELRPVSDKRLNDLTIGLKSLKELKDLSIILPMNYELTENGIKDFAQNIAQLKHLNRLRIEIWRSASLSDQAIESLVQHLIQLKDLEILELSFSYMENITSRGIQSFHSIITQMTHLSNFWLIFRCCDKIDAETLKTLQQTLSQAPNLKEKILTIIN